jgi:ribosomal protein L37AE/L43A
MSKVWHCMDCGVNFVRVAHDEFGSPVCPHCGSDAVSPYKGKRWLAW